MRLNRFIALSTGISRRRADELITQGKVSVDGKPASLGTAVEPNSLVELDHKHLSLPDTTTVMLNKPVGYVCSRDGQGSKTIYQLLPNSLSKLKPVGRLDKDSSGLLILTNDGQLAYDFTHPSKQKQKVYSILLNKPLKDKDQKAIEHGVRLTDGLSRLKLQGTDKQWTITMNEGRNRQIRRTFAAVGYEVISLHRNQFGPYELGQLGTGLGLTLVTY